MIVSSCVCVLQHFHEVGTHWVYDRPLVKRLSTVRNWSDDVMCAYFRLSFLHFTQSRSSIYAYCCVESSASDTMRLVVILLKHNKHMDLKIVSECPSILRRSRWSIGRLVHKTGEQLHATSAYCLASALLVASWLYFLESTVFFTRCMAFFMHNQSLFS